MPSSQQAAITRTESSHHVSSTSSPLLHEVGEAEGGAEGEEVSKATTSRAGVEEELDGDKEQWKQRAMQAEALVVSLVSLR